MKLFLLTVAFMLLSPSIFAHPPTGIVTDKSGNVYFTDLETIWRLEPNGKVIVFRAGVSGRHVHELAIDSANNILGADLSYESEKWISSVWKMTPSGELTYLLEPTSNPPRGMSMWLDSQGRSYFIDQNNNTRKTTLILRRTPDGQVSTFAGSSFGFADGKGTEAQFSSIQGLFFTTDDTIYLTDGVNLRKITSDGTVTTITKDLTKRTSEDRPALSDNGSLTGLSVAQDGIVFVADAANQRLLKVDGKGNASVVYRGNDTYYANGVCVTATGDLYVLEVDSLGKEKPRVRKISSKGDNSIVAESVERPATTTAGHAAPTKVIVESAFDRYKYQLLYLVALLGVVIGIWQLRKKKAR